MIACAGCGYAAQPNARCGYCGHVNGVVAAVVPQPPPSTAVAVAAVPQVPQPGAYPPPVSYAQPGYPAQYVQPVAGYAVLAPPKSRTAYVLLGVFLGGLGIHNFYAGRTGIAVTQLLLMLLLGWTGVVAIGIWIWVIIEVCTVKTDGRGQYLT